MITQTKFTYNIQEFPYFFSNNDTERSTDSSHKYYRNVMTRRFYKYIRSDCTVLDDHVLDPCTGLTFGEMALYMIVSKNKKRSQQYRLKRKSTSL